MISPQGRPEEQEEEWNEPKRVCLSLQDEDITVEPPDITVEPPDITVEPPDITVEPPDINAERPDVTVEPSAVHMECPPLTLECPPLTLDSRVDSNRVNYHAVGASAPSRGCTGVTKKAVEFEGTTVEFAADFGAVEEKSAIMESSVDKLQPTDETLGSNIGLGLKTATSGSDSVASGSNTTSQSNCSTLGNDNVPLESNDVSLGSNVVALGSNNTTVESGSSALTSTASCERAEGSDVQVSVIIPVYNAAPWLDECLQAVSDQDFEGTLEVSVFDDGSTDNSREMAESWRERLRIRGVSMVISGHNTDRPRGVGFAKNKAVAQSSGQYLCFQDADDVMMPQRVRLQYEAAVLNPKTIIGCQVRRVPEGSTERYTRWINTLSPEQLLTQVYTSHGPTVIMPTWFCSRPWFQEVGSFDEGGKGVPEDLLWFYQSLRQGGGVIRVDECLLIYRYHEHAATHSVLEETIWNLRVDFLQERVLGHWDSFTIWNAGKQGRKLYRSLMSTNQKKVKAFCDVDENKIKKGFYTYEESKERPKPRIPVLHYRDSSPPFIVCVKLDMTGGVLEETLLSLSLTEGVDYYHFS